MSNSAATLARAGIREADIELSERDFDDALLRYRDYPLEYVDENILARLGIEFEPRQRRVLEAIFKHRKVLIPTHHAFGKSFLCAVLALTISNLYPVDHKGTTFAPTFRQVKDILWAEMRDIFGRVNVDEIILQGKMTITRYEIGPNAFAVGFAPRQSARNAETPQVVAGKHSEVIYIIIDEAGGITRQVAEQIEALKSAGKIIFVVWIGNPMSASSEFGRMCLTEKGEGYTIIHETAYTAANMVVNGLTSIEAIRKEAVKIRALPSEQRKEYYDDKHYEKPFPTLISPGWVMECYIKWGESALFFSRCIGEWSKSSDDTLIPLERMEEVMRGTYMNAEGNKVWISEELNLAKWDGVTELFSAIDCSGEGADKNYLFTLEGNREFYKKAFSKTWEKSDIDYRGTKMVEDGPYIARHIYENLILPYLTRKHLLLIDCTGGFGNTVYDALMRYNLDPRFIKIKKVNFAENANDEILYDGIIAEMAYQLAEDICSPDGILLEPNDDLKNQITSRKKKEGKDLRNDIESKKDYKTHAGTSPDEFDALMMANRGRRLRLMKNNKKKVFEALSRASIETNSMSGSITDDENSGEEY